MPPAEKTDKSAVKRKYKRFKLNRNRASGRIAGDGDGQESGTAAVLGGGDNGSARGSGEPGVEEGKVATLASMEQQLRAGVVPTLPHSREARSALALSLPPLAPVFSRASRAVTKVVDMGPVEPVRRKRKYTKQNKKAGEWVLVTTWQFSEKAFRGLSFAKELWMMMTSFGDPRGSIRCKCTKRGNARCPCLAAVAAMESLVHAFATRLVAVCRQWSCARVFYFKHLRMAMPGEMREFLSWKEAHTKGSVTPAEEKRAGIQLCSGQDEADGDPEDAKIDVDEVSKVVEGEDGVLLEGKGSFDSPEDDDISTGVEEKELVVEEEEVTSRILQRKTFADKLTSDMEEGDYVDMYFEYRKAFFLVSRGGRKDSTPGSRKYFLDFVGLDDKSREAKSRKTLDALAYMMYDYVGLVVETAIRQRNGGRLVALPEGAPLTEAEINAAAIRIPCLPDREQRERVRAMRADNPEGISSKPLSRFAVGLEYRGDPRKWPCNTIERGQVRVEGGEVVDASDKRLAQEAMALLETDFADFDS